VTLNPTITRRTLIATGAAGAGAVALAACSGGGGSANTAPSSEASGKTLAAVADVPVGEAKSVKLPDGSPGIVARPTASTVACFSAICTHMGCTVKPSGQKLDCPCHGSQFDALTGSVLHGPATEPLPKIAVTVAGGNVVTTAT
jgi:Rieske Fe-S protein